MSIYDDTASGAGKGSFRRPNNDNKFRNNFDSINWSKTSTPAFADRKSRESRPARPFTKAVKSDQPNAQ
jgi:hypothetical protein